MGCSVAATSIGAIAALRGYNSVQRQILGDHYPSIKYDRSLSMPGSLTGSHGVKTSPTDNSPLVTCRYCQTTRKASKDNCPSCAGREVE